MCAGAGGEREGSATTTVAAAGRLHWRAENAVHRRTVTWSGRRVKSASLQELERRWQDALLLREHGADREQIIERAAFLVTELLVKGRGLQDLVTLLGRQ